MKGRKLYKKQMIVITEKIRPYKKKGHVNVKKKIEEKLPKQRKVKKKNIRR